MGQSESDDIFVSELKAKELMVTELVKVTMSILS